MFRDREIYQILDRILYKGEKMLFINGMRGIGKSSVVKQVQHFLNERKQCTSGNIYIECKNV